MYVARERGSEYATLMRICYELERNICQMRWLVSGQPYKWCNQSDSHVQSKTIKAQKKEMTDFLGGYFRSV